jgi:dihydrolipoamide dehydrogenase
MGRLEMPVKIAVIGGGPGGYVAAIRAAQLGADVTLIEKNKLGGTCLHVGCIPTKALLHCSRMLDNVRKGAQIGIKAEPAVNFSQVQTYKESIIRRLVVGVNSLMKANGITILNGTASFKDSSVLIVKGEAETTIAPDKIIIAAGSMPAVPPIPGIEVPQRVDSTDALGFTTPPRSLLIIGGGVIGVELASVYNSFGTKVAVVEMASEILPLTDAELSGILRKSLTKRGIEFFVSAKVESIEDAGADARVNITVAGKNLAFEAERVLVCVGRRADTESLSLDAAGIKHEGSRIVVDEHMRTNVPGVYAVGDCLGRVMLAHVASAQGEVAAENAMGHETSYSEYAVPSCVYTEPEFASVGLTEREALERGIEYSVGKFPLIANGRALIANGGEGLVKIISDKKSGVVLGLHILGANATDIIGDGAIAIKLGATLNRITDTIYAHPTIAEAIREAALAAEGRAIHMPNK